MGCEKNYTKLEEDRLITLVGKYKSILECKKTDSRANSKKQATWEKVAAEFNAGLPEEGNRREGDALKKKYNNMKAALSKRIATQNMEKLQSVGERKRKVSDLCDGDQKLLIDLRNVADDEAWSKSHVNKQYEGRQQTAC